MRKMMRRMATVGGLALMFAPVAAWAQESVRVRGTIERVDGPTLLVKARDGAELKIVLTANGMVVGHGEVVHGGHQARFVRGCHRHAPG